MDYKTANALGATVTTVDLTYRYWKASFDLAGVEDPEVAIAGAYEWFTGIVDKVAGPVVPLSVQKEPSGLAPETVPTDDLRLDVVKFSLARRTDGKYELYLFGKYGDGPGKYPDIRFVAERERMWNMVEDIIGAFDVTNLPVEYACSWRATYRLGKETPKGGRYKDLVKLEVIA